MGRKQRVLICGSPDAADDVASVCDVISTSRFLSGIYEPHDVTESAGVDFMLENRRGFNPDDILVLLLGDEYGDLVDNVFSITQLLSEMAGEEGLERMVFLKSTERVVGRQRDFLDGLSSHLVRARYETGDEAAKGVVAALTHMKRSSAGDVLSPRDVIGALCTSVGWDAGARLFVSTTGKEPEGSGKMLFDVAKKLDLIVQKSDPEDEDETFRLNIQIDDLDAERLAALVEADNRYSAKAGRPPISLLDFLKRHRFAAPDGRIFDRAFYLFPRAPLAPEKEHEEGLMTDEQLKDAATASISRIEESLERDLKAIEAVENTADDLTVAKLTHRAFLNIYDEIQKVFVPTAKKYGDTDESDYLDTCSLADSLRRICRIRTRHAENLRNICEDLIDDIEHFFEHPICVGNDILPDGVPESFMKLCELLMPQDSRDKGSEPVTKADLDEALRRLASGKNAVIDSSLTATDSVRMTLVPAPAAKNEKGTGRKPKVGPWQRKFLKVDFEAQTITFKADKEPITRKSVEVVVSKKADKTWAMLLGLLTAKDAEGYVEIDKINKSWQTRLKKFVPGGRKKGIVDITHPMMILRYHIHSEKGRGKGGAGRIHLSPEINQELYNAERINYLKWKAALSSRQ